MEATLIKIAPLIWGLWWFCAAWLVLTSVGLVYLFLYWLYDYASPMRHESAIVAGWVLFYSWPALLGILLTSVVPRTGLSPTKRIAAAGLLIFCIGGTFAFGYLQG